MKYSIVLMENEGFFGLACNEGIKMPFTKESKFSLDLREWHSGNQASSVLVSSKGRYIYSHKPFKFDIENGVITLEGEDIVIKRNGNSLKEAYQGLKNDFFKLDHKIPNPLMFEKPQYNTWIEMGWDCTEEKVIKYAKSIIKHGYPAGVLMIDDCWCKDYGVWDFDREKFPHPHEMIKALHDMGFVVMLWICPFVSLDSPVFREIENKGILFKNKDGSTAVSHWWNGYSGVIDLCKKEGRDFLISKLDFLQKEYDIDGFKLDAADPDYYHDFFEFNGVNKSYQAQEYAALGERYDFSELRVAFNNNLRGVAHRLRDKNHSWDYDGLNTLIPDGICEGLLGYPYFCPDMIGGGMLLDFQREDFKFDEELYVRYAEASSLLPMMQFSLLPYKILSEENQKIVLDMVKLHVKYKDVILSLVEEARTSGEMIIRSMNYVFNKDEYLFINDQFMLGDSIMVAPQLKKGNRREVVIPEGSWVDELGNKYEEGVYEIEVPLSRLPVFTRV